MLTKAPILAAKHLQGRVISPLSTASSVIARHFLCTSDAPDEVPSPLSALKQMAQTKNLCDENGFRLPDKHWAFVISVNGDDNQVWMGMFCTYNINHHRQRSS